MRAALLLLLGALSGCYSPRLSSGGFRCGEGYICPRGLACVEGLCRDPADVPGTPGAADGSAPASTDGTGGGLGGDAAAAPDLAGRDLAGLDLSGSGPDLAGGPDGGAGPPPCKGAGFAVGPGVYACRGTFAAGQAASLCGAGYRLCTTGSGVTAPETACGGDFFVANVPLSLTLNRLSGAIEREFCGGVGGMTRALLGCGQLPTERLRMPCEGLRVQMPCSSPAAGWRCTAGAADAANDNPGSGALCCRS
jgi:hypothetical protein